MRRHGYALLAASLLLAACQQKTEQPGAPADSGNAAAEAMPHNMANMAGHDMSGDAAEGSFPTDDWVGKWVGVEGLALDIAKGDKPGHYVLKISLLDGTSVYNGMASGEAIAFMRGGHEERVRRVKGAETGLKYLADKADCLMIVAGEGFCRD